MRPFREFRRRNSRGKCKSVSSLHSRMDPSRNKYVFIRDVARIKFSPRRTFLE